MRGLQVLGLLLAIALTSACVSDRPIVSPFGDDFDRPVLGRDYLNTGGSYTLRDGKLFVQGAYNRPLWLRRRLPANAEITFEAAAASPAGDIKVEAWGDGRSAATGRGAYVATGYVFIQGGWHNTVSAICRLDEHGKDRRQRRGPKVEANRIYQWKIRRQGGTIHWFIDGEPFLEFEDPQPLSGSGHAFFGFNNWNAPVVFNNLTITPL